MNTYKFLRHIILSVFIVSSITPPIDIAAYAMSVPSAFQRSEADERVLNHGRLAFKSISKANYLHTIIGNALADGLSTEDLIDRIVYQQSMFGSLFNIQLGTIIKEDSSFLCTYNSSGGQIRLRYRLGDTSVRDTADKMAIPLSADVNLLVEIVEEKEVWPSGLLHDTAEDLSALAGRAVIQSDAAAKHTLGAQLAYRLRYASVMEIEKFLSECPLDIHNSSSCLLGILASINILQNNKLRQTEAWTSIQ